MYKYKNITDAWNQVRNILSDEPFSLTHKLMHGGTAGIPIQWVEIDYKGNIRTAENFDKLIYIIKNEFG